MGVERMEGAAGMSPQRVGSARYALVTAKNSLKTAVLMAALIAFLAFLGNALGGPRLMSVFLLLGLAINLGAYWFSDRLALMGTGAYPADPYRHRKLYEMVRRLAREAQIPEPRLYIVPSSVPNAFATGRNPDNAVVAVNEGLLSLLDDAEIEAVLAHELSHVKNRDILIGSVAAAIAGVITWLAHMARFALIFGGGRDREGGNALGALAMIVLAPIAALLIQLAISRSREYQADASGAALVGNPLALASALGKLERAGQLLPAEEVPASRAHLYTVSPLHGGGLAALFSTHPPVERRIERLYELAGRTTMEAS
jgi:heat shock protein HtpX